MSQWLPGQQGVLPHPPTSTTTKPFPAASGLPKAKAVRYRAAPLTAIILPQRSLATPPLRPFPSPPSRNPSKPRMTAVGAVSKTFFYQRLPMFLRRRTTRHLPLARLLKEQKRCRPQPPTLCLRQPIQIPLPLSPIPAAKPHSGAKARLPGNVSVAKPKPNKPGPTPLQLRLWQTPRNRRMTRTMRALRVSRWERAGASWSKLT